MTTIEDKVDEILDRLPKKRYKTIDDIVEEHGWSQSYVRTNPWTQPNFGVSDYPGKEKRWMIETYEDWYSVPPSVRKREWDRMGSSKKRQIVAK